MSNCRGKVQPIFIEQTIASDGIGVSQGRYEEPIVRPDGEAGWVRTSKLPLKNPDGSVFGYWVSMRM